MSAASLPARRGFCLILSSPSGAGKTTLARALLASDAGLMSSVSVTTRPPRAGEVEGESYFFFSGERFEAMRGAGGLLESAEVFGNFYGTPAQPVKEALEQGRDIVFDVDWQGAASIASILPEDTVRVFILPPSGEELARRIHTRGTDAKEVIEKRMRAAAREISHWNEYDYVLVNQDVAESLSALKAILQAERLKRPRQHGLPGFVAGLTPATPAMASPSGPQAGGQG
jgi:guanylate kinase